MLKYSVKTMRSPRTMLLTCTSKISANELTPPSLKHPTDLHKTPKNLNSTVHSDNQVSILLSLDSRHDD